MEASSRRRNLLFPFLIFTLILAFGCNFPEVIKPTPDSKTNEKMELGKVVLVLEATIDPDGERLSVDLPGDPLDGMEIYAPKGALIETAQLEISHREVIAHAYGDYFTTLTPLVSIHFKGTVPEGYIEISLPVSVPEGYFALPFHMDSDNGTLEGLPVIGEAEGSLRFVSRRFSDFIIAAVKETVLSGDIETTFAFGRDNFRFPNQGSMIATDGHCTGQTLANLYYHENLNVKSLYDSYDGYNTSFFETPELWQDDILAYKLSSILQQYVWVEGNPDVLYWSNFEFENPFRTYFTIAYLMLVTEQPQLVVLTDGVGGPGHAVIAYKKQGSTFFVSDPNYPRDDARRLHFDLAATTFQSYHSGLTADGDPQPFDHIYFIPPKDLVNWEFLGDLWTQVKDGHFTFDPFPNFQINIVDQDRSYNKLPPVAVEREYETVHDSLEVYIDQLNQPGIMLVWQGISEYEEPQFVSQKPVGEASYLNLHKGENYFGFLIETQDESGKFSWAGFKWIKITVKEMEGEAEEPGQSGDLSLEECDMTPYLAYEIEAPEITKFSETSPCSQDCRAKIQITNESSESVNIYYYKYSDGRDAFGWTGEGWDGFGAILPGEIASTGWVRRYAISDACQWVNQGISKICAVRSHPGCDWLSKQHVNGFENSGIQIIEIPSPCP